MMDIYKPPDLLNKPNLQLNQIDRDGTHLGVSSALECVLD